MKIYKLLIIILIYFLLINCCYDNKNQNIKINPEWYVFNAVTYSELLSTRAFGAKNKEWKAIDSFITKFPFDVYKKSAYLGPPVCYYVYVYKFKKEEVNIYFFSNEKNQYLQFTNIYSPDVGIVLDNYTEKITIEKVTPEIVELQQSTEEL